MSNDEQDFQKRIKERLIWIYWGWILAIAGGSIFLGSAIAFFLNLPFMLVKVLIGIGLLGILLGGVFVLLFGRLGWSKNKVIDMLLNRVSILLIIVGITLEVAKGIFSESNVLREVPGGYGLAILGTFLILLGVRFQMTPE